MKRLDCIASLINNKKAIVADIGSDHAFLAVKLLKNKQVKTVYNIELNQKPLDNGIRNLKANFVYKNTVNVINDGLKNWKKTKSFDYVVISGMGGKNIVEILKNTKVKINFLILCPNNNAFMLRKYLSNHNWKFVFETIVKESKYYYPVICVSKTKGIKYSNNKDWYFGKLNLKQKEVNFVKMNKERLNYLKKNKIAKYNKKYAMEVKLLNDCSK